MANRRRPSRPTTGQIEQRLKEKGGISAKDRDGAALTLAEELGSNAGLGGMGFLAFVGRVLFTSIFVLTAYQEAKEFGHDGGPTAKSLEPKFNLFVKHVSTYTGLALPHIEIKTVVAATIFLRAYGAFMFILFSPIGAFMLEVYLLFITPIAYDFYNYKKGSPQFVQLFDQFLQNAALYAAVAFYWGMKRSIKLAKRG